MPRGRRLIRWAGRVPLALGLVVCIPGAGAWGPQTRMRMADEAVRLMPSSLRMALQTHRKSLMRGMLTPLTDHPMLVINRSKTCVSRSGIVTEQTS